jgi:hypothetical protein
VATGCIGFQHWAFFQTNERGSCFAKGLETSDRATGSLATIRASQTLEAGKPIRSTPSVGDFRAIVDHICNQRFSDVAERARISWNHRAGGTWADERF